jgi:hypothetical protein
MIQHGKVLKPMLHEFKHLTKREYEVLPNELKKYFSSIEAARRWGGPIMS